MFLFLFLNYQSGTSILKLKEIEASPSNILSTLGEWKMILET